MAQIKLSVRFAWWLKPCLHLLAFCCALAGMRPDQEKLAGKIKSAMRVDVE